MLNIQFRKIFRDIIKSKSRTILTILAIAIGIIGSGSVLFAYSILMREMNKNYMQTNPASASFYINNIDENLVEYVKSNKEIKDIELAGFYTGRIEVSKNQWIGLWLFVIDDFNNLKLNKFKYEKGNFPPKTGEILLERVALGVAEASIGEERLVVLSDNKKVKLKISGTVHAPGEAPAWMEHLVYGYTTKETLSLLTDRSLNELNIMVAKDSLDYKHITNVVSDLSREIESKGYKIEKIAIPYPGKHPHASQLSSLLFLLQTFGFLALILSTILMINLISSMVAQQTRQIGIMKTIGAKTSQIVRLYLGNVLLLSVISLIIAIPIALLFSRGYSGFSATMLNFTIMDNSIPLTEYIKIIAIGIIIPLLSSLYPIIRGAKITVKEALYEYGTKTNDVKINFNINSFNRILLLSIRSTFRKKGRIILTIATIAIGGAIFITSLNVGEGIKKTIDKIKNIALYNIDLKLKSPVVFDKLDVAFANIQNVEKYETWGETNGVIIFDNGKQSNEFSLIGVAENTTIFKPNIINGRWFLPEEENVIVVRSNFFGLNTKYKVGDKVKVKLNNNIIEEFKIIGVEQFIGLPTAFISYKNLQKVVGSENVSTILKIVSKKQDNDSVTYLAKNIEKEFDEQGLIITDNFNTGEYRQALEDHFLIIVSFLVMMAFFIIIVGGMALASTMSIQVIERTKEIGIMKAIGASKIQIIHIFQQESFFIGVISFVISIIVGLPITYFVGNIFGYIFFKFPLSFGLDIKGFFIWFGITIVFAVIASLLPAMKAVSLTVKETLSYE